VYVTHSLGLPSTAQSVPVARTLCRAYLSMLLVDDASIEDIALSLTEACSNVVQHGGVESYELEITVTRRICHVEVTSSAAGLEREKVLSEAGGTTSGKSRGLGLSLIERISDRLEVTRSVDLGIVTISFDKRIDLLDSSPMVSLA
jgi:serine/threonine-protein kinase RsbW